MTDDTKIINIQKFKPNNRSNFSKQEMPFTLICNKVLSECMNTTAGFIWMYLQSKPETWKPCKWEIMKRFNISESTYKRQMKYLTATNLIETHPIRNARGQITDWRIIVLNGLEFNASADSFTGRIHAVDNSSKSPHSSSNPPHILPHFHQSVKNDTPAKPTPSNGFNQSVKNDTLAPHQSVKNTTSGEMTPHINKYINTLQKKEKDIINTSSGDEGYLGLFEKFYSVYPRKKGKQDAMKWFKKNKPTQEFVSMLIEDVKKRLKSEWTEKEIQYLPYPASYLNGKRWQDEIEEKESRPKKFPSAEERASNQQKILDRETRAAEEKRKEIAATRGGITQITQRFDFQAALRKQKEEMESLRMNAVEYNNYLNNRKKEN